MKKHNNKLIVRRYFEEVLRNDRYDLIEELFAPEIRDLVRRYAFFAPESFVISDMIAEDNKVMVRWDTCPLSGVEFDQNGFAVYYLENGMIIGLEMMDFNGVLRQIGTEVFSQGAK
ncbi:MAG: nuclear transport factor 2 family protein [Anaerolineales bacterium]|nr:nuclear transport factor 2 family protein [Anaerolineales bacterium]